MLVSVNQLLLINAGLKVPSGFQVQNFYRASVAIMNFAATKGGMLVSEASGPGVQFLLLTGFLISRLTAL